MAERPTLVVPNPWSGLRERTAARIALGRSGVSLPTRAHLDFQAAHALARDAVHHPLAVEPLQAALTARGLSVERVHSAAGDRRIYLQRPDQGRRLDDASRAHLQRLGATPAAGADLGLVLADGLSAQALERHALPLIDALRAVLAPDALRLAPVVIVEQGRVAVADEIGALLGVRLVAILIGERPGLSSPDSLGVYLTYAPRIGLHDALRNCISNIRPEGLPPERAALTLAWLVREALRRCLTGVDLKEGQTALPAPEGPAPARLDAPPAAPASDR